MFFSSNIQDFVQSVSLPERFNLIPFSYEIMLEAF